MMEQNDKATAEEIQFLRLVKRSPDQGDGWRSVSPMLERLVARFTRFFEQERRDDRLFVRLTPEGETLATYASAA
ncbi:MAG: hypothetical protein CL555_05900 [Algoriphagus sp.]|nr:hypothetical protein [Algoriphagus sp.]